MRVLSNDPAFRPVRFELLTDAEPGVLPRVLASFARRDLVPDLFRARRQGPVMLVEVGLDAMPSEMLQATEGGLRAMVGVRRVAVMLCAPGLDRRAA